MGYKKIKRLPVNDFPDILKIENIDDLSKINEIDDYYAYPTPEDSTPLGQVPEEPRKGSINPYSPNYFTPGYVE